MPRSLLGPAFNLQKPLFLLFFFLFTQSLVWAKRGTPVTSSPAQESTSVSGQSSAAEPSSPSVPVHKEFGTLQLKLSEVMEGATLWIDNSPVQENLPAGESTFQLPVGTYQIRIYKPGIELPPLSPIPIDAGKTAVITIGEHNQSATDEVGSKPSFGPPQNPEMISAPAPLPPWEKGWLSIETLRDAQVSVDDVPQPHRYALSVGAGMHKILVSAPGTSPKRLSVLVPKNTHVVVSAFPNTEATENTAPLFGLLQGIADITNPPPPEASYWLNGRQITREALERGLQFPAGPVSLIVEKPNHDRCLAEQFFLQAGGSHVFHLACEAQGIVYVSSQPIGAEVRIRQQHILGSSSSGKESSSETINGPRQEQPPELFRSQGITPVELQLPAGETTLYITKEGYQMTSLVVQVSAGQRTQVSATLTPGTSFLSPLVSSHPKTPKEENMEAERAKQFFVQQQAELSATSAFTTPRKHFVAFLDPGFPYYLHAGMHVGVWRSASEQHGIDITAQVRSTFLFGEVVLGGRFLLQKMDPFAIGTYALVSAGGALGGGNTVSFETGLPLTLRAADWVYLTFTPILQLYSDQYCPMEDTISQESQKKDNMAALVALGTPRYAGDGCRTQGMYNPIYAAAGVADPKVSSAIPYRGTDGKVRPEFLVDGTPVLGRFTQLRASLQIAMEFRIPHVPLSLFFHFRWTPNQKERPLFTRALGEFMPSHEGPDPYLPGNALHGSLGLVYRY